MHDYNHVLRTELDQCPIDEGVKPQFLLFEGFEMVIAGSSNGREVYCGGSGGCEGDGLRRVVIR